MSNFQLNSFDSEDDDSDYVPSEDEEKSDQEFKTISDTKVTEIVAETSPQPSAVDEKVRVESLWKQFLGDGTDVSHHQSQKLDTKVLAKPDSLHQTHKLETANEEDSCKPSTSIQTLEASVNEKEDLKSEKSHLSRKADKVAIQNSTSSAKKRSLGLNSVLGKLQNKKPKVTTLQKSLTDWESFKKDEGIGSDLEIFNRGKNGYLERQAFLMRSDLRSFEVEKSIRLSKK